MSVDSCAEIKSAPSVVYVTSSGRVWRKVPESGARSEPLVMGNGYEDGSVVLCQTARNNL